MEKVEREVWEDPGSDYEDTWKLSKNLTFTQVVLFRVLQRTKKMCACTYIKRIIISSQLM